jgi:uncharacterized integral membrane protein
MDDFCIALAIILMLLALFICMPHDKMTIKYIFVYFTMQLIVHVHICSCESLNHVCLGYHVPKT